MKKINLTLLLVAIVTSLSAQRHEVTLFPKGQLSEPTTYIEMDDTTGNRTGGRSVLRKHNVGDPLFTIYKAEKPNDKDLTIVVCPGGGYARLAYDLEGLEICEMLNENGYDAVLLKYRVPRRPNRPKHEAPLEDLQRTISLVRSNGADYGLRTGCVGVMGFSAGGHLSVMSCCNERSYEPIDEADGASCHPDFCALIYPAYLSGENFELAPEVSIGSHTPKTFIVQSQDDEKYIDSSIYYYYALKEAEVAATMHLYNSGGHGYGLRPSGSESQEWYLAYLAWLGAL